MIYGLSNNFNYDTSAAHAVMRMLYTFAPFRQTIQQAYGDSMREDAGRIEVLNGLAELFNQMENPEPNQSKTVDTTGFLKALYPSGKIAADPVKFFSDVNEQLFLLSAGLMKDFVGTVLTDHGRRSFTHLTLPVKNCKDIYESLDEYLKTPV